MKPARGRGRGRGLPPQPVNPRSFKEASRSIEENLKKHLEKQEDEGLVSDSDSDSDPNDTEELVGRLLDSYGGTVTEELKELMRNAVQSSACLICISSVKKTDQIWSCNICYVSFHINCIQRWAKDSIFQQKQQLEDDVDRVAKEAKICWSCPKCRTDRKVTAIPQKYLCFCGKESDPQFDPWQTPHSCGNRCSKQLSHCSHKCMLLCHPGPCPPCPQTVSTSCYCGQAVPTVKRCSDSVWSCGRPCGGQLGCNTHPCQKVCHPEECPPCPRTSIQTCQCHKTKEPRPCSAPLFKCGHPCGSLLSCGYHSCDLICHPGSCPPCPLSLDRLCPCGKSTVRLPCTEATPTCGDTCGKLLACSSHNCSERCHRGNCPSCLQMKFKECRCGAKKKEVQCAKTFACETKCKRTRDCQRHPCNKKCCVGTCPPCEQMCGKTLSCKNHKCLSRCHRGSCYPCQKTVDLKCNCGVTKITVPCGREKLAKPPRCRKPCTALTNCHHPEREQHNCHRPPCPPCKRTCEEKLTCGHICPSLCHDNVQQKIHDTSRPAGPWEEKAPVIQIVNQPCPPCLHPMPVTCLGGHDTSDWPCHLSKPAPCGRKCGRYLPCGNHTCERDCHKVRHAQSEDTAGANCKKCDSECQLERAKGCQHLCPLPCHPAPCASCTATVKMKCHCGINNLLRKCGEYLMASAKEKADMTCCQDVCPKMMECGHRCSLLCHRGPCSSTNDCRKKVKIFCPCKRKKEEFRCSQDKLVVCDDSCKSASQEAEEENKRASKEKENEEVLRNQREAQLFERRLEGGGKKRRRNRRTECAEENSTLWANNKILLLGSVTVVFLSVIIYISLYQ